MTGAVPRSGHEGQDRAFVPTFQGETADEVWLKVAEAFRMGRGSDQESQYGRTKELLHAILHIRTPQQRWIGSRWPALSPAFALAELMWVLAGSRDASFLTFWHPRIGEYMGYEPEYLGAYGHRLREHFGVDQLRHAASALRSSAESRQVVLQLWDPKVDLPHPDGTPARRDVPCNLCATLKVRHGRLEWTQVARSNDLVLGIPHNVIQFTTIQEILAAWIGVEVGTYTVLSDSLHVYERTWETVVRSSTTRLPKDKDGWGLPEPEWQPVFDEVWRCAGRLVQNDVTEIEARDMLRLDRLPVAYRNSICVLVAEAARRRGWPDTMAAASLTCSSALLAQLWRRWVERQDAKRRRRDTVG